MTMWTVRCEIPIKNNWIITIVTYCLKIEYIMTGAIKMCSNINWNTYFSMVDSRCYVVLVWDNNVETCLPMNPYVVIVICWSIFCYLRMTSGLPRGDWRIWWYALSGSTTNAILLRVCRYLTYFKPIIH